MVAITTCAGARRLPDSSRQPGGGGSVGRGAPVGGRRLRGAISSIRAVTSGRAAAEHSTSADEPKHARGVGGGSRAAGGKCQLSSALAYSFRSQVQPLRVFSTAEATIGGHRALLNLASHVWRGQVVTRMCWDCAPHLAAVLRGPRLTRAQCLMPNSSGVLCIVDRIGGGSMGRMGL